MFKAGEFIDFVSGYDAEFPTTVKGATPEEIDELQGVVGRPLPESYRQFLSAMGKKAGWINLGSDHGTDGTTDITVIKQWYKDYINEGRHHVPPNCIGISLSGPVFDVCLEDGGSLQEPRAIYSEGNSMYEEYAESLDKLLFRLAFFHYQPKRWKYFSQFRSTDKGRLIDQGREWVVSIGLSALWFSDRIALCAENPTASISLWQYDHGFLHARVAAASAGEIASMGHSLITRLGLQEVAS